MVAAKVLKTFGCNVRLGSSPSITTNFMNQIKIPQEEWFEICIRLNEALRDSERLDFLLSIPNFSFGSRFEIDEARKNTKEV